MGVGQTSLVVLIIMNYNINMLVPLSIDGYIIVNITLRYYLFYGIIYEMLLYSFNEKYCTSLRCLPYPSDFYFVCSELSY